MRAATNAMSTIEMMVAGVAGDLRRVNAVRRASVASQRTTSNGTWASTTLPVP